MARSRLFPEIIVDILLRLPVKSLVRFRCISESTTSLIDSPDFSKSHLSTSNRTSLILFKHPLYANHQITHFYALDIDYGGLKEAIQLDINSSTPIACVLCSCNGLLLLRDDDIKSVLWNPFTRRAKKLPDHPIGGRYSSLSRLDAFGLCYDHSNDDYKVVRILYENHEVWIYSLRSNSWRNIGNFLDGVFLPSFANLGGKVINGALYWMCGRDNDDSGVIVAFDIATEKFCVLEERLPSLPLPEYVVDHDDDNDDHVCFHELAGRLCLCLFRSIQNDYNREVDVYVGEEDGGGLSWCKEITIRPGEIPGAFYSLIPLSYSKYGEKVLLDVDGQDIVWYDLQKKTGEIMEICGTPDHWIHSITCRESLVSLGDDSTAA